MIRERAVTAKKVKVATCFIEKHIVVMPLLFNGCFANARPGERILIKGYNTIGSIPRLYFVGVKFVLIGA